MSQLCCDTAFPSRALPVFLRGGATLKKDALQSPPLAWRAVSRSALRHTRIKVALRCVLPSSLPPSLPSCCLSFFSFFIYLACCCSVLLLVSSLSIYLSVLFCLSIYLPMNQSINQSIYLSISPSIYPSLYLSLLIYLPISFYLYIYLAIHFLYLLSIDPSISLFISLSTALVIYLCLCLVWGYRHYPGSDDSNKQPPNATKARKSLESQRSTRPPTTDRPAGRPTDRPGTLPQPSPPNLGEKKQNSWPFWIHSGRNTTTGPSFRPKLNPPPRHQKSGPAPLPKARASVMTPSGRTNLKARCHGMCVSNGRESALREKYRPQTARKNPSTGNGQFLRVV